MYRVVIVDDEPIIVNGLVHGVDWKKMDCEVVGTAYNGQDGTKLIRELRPDFLFSDICMNVVDGLTMIAGIKSEFPKLCITILTGFREFDYAQTAIRLGVIRFLLKPSKIDEIEEAVQAMKAVKESEQINRAEPAEDTDADANAPANFIVSNALEYIRNNFNKKITLLEVADNVYVSQWHLSKLLNHYMGQNFSEILNGIRIEKAKELLADPSLRIGDISDEVGFLDIAHFSRVFKKNVGVSAQEFRNNLVMCGTQQA